MEFELVMRFKETDSNPSADKPLSLHVPPAVIEQSLAKKETFPAIG
jgi:hypothetical protein